VPIRAKGFFQDRPGALTFIFQSLERRDLAVPLDPSPRASRATHGVIVDGPDLLGPERVDAA
jgi:hypothetical protein